MCETSVKRIENNHNMFKKKKVIFTIACIVFVFLFFLLMNKFVKGVIEDTKRMDTIHIPEVFNIDSINTCIEKR